MMKDSLLHEAEVKRRIKAEGSMWIAQQRFWLFGTAKYVDGTEIGEHKLKKDIRHYFNTIDKALLNRRDYNEGRRLERLVFIENGKSRCNKHFHFFIKGTYLWQYRQLRKTAESHWLRHIAQASDIKIEDNIELIHERKGYCWKEFDNLHSETLFTDCCHLTPTTTHSAS